MKSNKQSNSKRFILKDSFSPLLFFLLGVLFFSAGACPAAFVFLFGQIPNAKRTLICVYSGCFLVFFALLLFYFILKSVKDKSQRNRTILDRAYSAISFMETFPFVLFCFFSFFSSSAFILAGAFYAKNALNGFTYGITQLLNSVFLILCGSLFSSCARITSWMKKVSRTEKKQHVIDLKERYEQRINTKNVRIAQLEAKCRKLYDIINNLASDLGVFEGH